MPNIYEVAKRAGVSTATVSRVLSRPQVVSPETRQRVLQAVKAMAYAPNSAAKNLRTLRTGKLLVTVPDISNPFFSLILQGIEDAAQREGHAVLFGDTQHDENREERYALMLQRKEADGLSLLGHRLQKQSEKQQQWAEAPTVREKIAGLADDKQKANNQILGFLRNEVGATLRRTGQDGVAARTFETAIDIDPRTAPAYLNLGDARER